MDFHFFLGGAELKLDEDDDTSRFSQPILDIPTFFKFSFSLVPAPDIWMEAKPEAIDDKPEAFAIGDVGPPATLDIEAVVTKGGKVPTEFF